MSNYQQQSVIPGTSGHGADMATNAVAGAAAGMAVGAMQHYGYFRGPLRPVFLWITIPSAIIFFGPAPTDWFSWIFWGFAIGNLTIGWYCFSRFAYYYQSPLVRWPVQAWAFLIRCVGVVLVFAMILSVTQRLFGTGPQQPR